MEGRYDGKSPYDSLTRRPSAKPMDPLSKPTTFKTSQSSSKSSSRSGSSVWPADPDFDDSYDTSRDELDFLSSPPRAEKPRGKDNKALEHPDPAYRKKNYTAMGLKFKKNNSGTEANSKPSSQPSPKKSQPSTSRLTRAPSSQLPRTKSPRRNALKSTPTIDISDESSADPPKAPPRPRPKPTQKKAENRPPPNPPSSSTEGSLSTPTRNKHTTKADGSLSPSKDRPKPLAKLSSWISPLHSTSNESNKARTAAAFPVSPISTEKTDKGKGRAKSPGKPKTKSSQARKGVVGLVVESSEEDEPSGPKPFPMMLSPLHEPQRAAKPFPMAVSPMSTPRHNNKRPSPERDDTSARKKRREETPSGIASRMAYLDDGHAQDEAMFLDPTVDPKTLCPYCDDPLPPKPTPLLRRLLETVAKKSRPSPRPTNPMGRKAPVEAFVALCQRHRFESQILPEAESKGWPKEIEFDKLEKRVRKLKSDLKALITDEEVRRNSKFWMEVMAEVKAKGTRAMTGVRNQFANFDKTQPGYYGEQGSVIIQHTLFDMFPPATINLNDIKPLNANEFMQRILVPEVAKALIMEDQNVAPAKAIKILRESTSYGVAMFPEDGGEWGETKHKKSSDKLGVADMMVMERARKRRIELEKEEREEEEEKRLNAVKSRPRPKPLGKKKTLEVDGEGSNAHGSDDVPLDLDGYNLGSDDEDYFFSNLKNSPKSSLPDWKTSMYDEEAADEPSSSQWLRSGSPAKKSSRASSMDLETDGGSSSNTRSPRKKRTKQLGEGSRKMRSPSVEILDRSPKKRTTSAMDVDATPRAPRAALSDNFQPLIAARNLGGGNLNQRKKAQALKKCESFSWLLDK